MWRDTARLRVRSGLGNRGEGLYCSQRCRAKAAAREVRVIVTQDAREIARLVYLPPTEWIVARSDTVRGYAILHDVGTCWARGRDLDAVRASLCEQAAKLGGNAVLNLTRTQSTQGGLWSNYRWTEHELTGRAVVLGFPISTTDPATIAAATTFATPPLTYRRTTSGLTCLIPLMLLALLLCGILTIGASFAASRSGGTNSTSTGTHPVTTTIPTPTVVRHNAAPPGKSPTTQCLNSHITAHARYATVSGVSPVLDEGFLDAFESS